MSAKPTTNFASRLLLTICTLLLCATSAATAESNHPEDRAAAKALASNTYGQLPLSFEPNQGQTDQQVKFLWRGPSYALFLTPIEAVFTLKTLDGKPTQQRSRQPMLAKPFKQQTAHTKYSVLCIGLKNASHAPHISGIDELPGKSNYFVGKDPKNWHSNIPTYRKVKYSGVYPGVDLVYYGDQRQLEYDFVVAPGADPEAIGLEFTGAQRLTIDRAGDLVAQLPGGSVIEHAPVIYQEIDGVRRPVAGGYQIRRDHTVGFKLAAYDHGQPLTIDPSLVYSTYLGGSNNDRALGIAVDSSGNAYVAGATASANFPITLGAYKTTFDSASNGGVFVSGGNAFVVKLNNSGTALVYSTYLGDGSAADVAVDASGNAYVVGETSSSSFPVTGGVVQPFLRSSNGNGFVTKLTPDGAGLVYSTYLGGSGTLNGVIEIAFGIAVDSAGDAYISGDTNSSDFPTTPGAFQTSAGGGGDAFVTKLNPTGTALVYSTYLGGSGADGTGRIAIDSAGDAYVTGGTGSSNFPTTIGAAQTSPTRAYVTKLNPTGTGLVYSTYLPGASGSASSLGIAVDASGNAYVSAWAGSTSPTAFVAKLNSAGSALVYSTPVGGSGPSLAFGVALDSFGNAYVAGQANGAFVEELGSTGSPVFGGPLSSGSNDAAMGIATDSLGNAYVTGNSSGGFPTTTGAFQTVFGGGIENAFVTEIGTTSATANTQTGSPVVVDLGSTIVMTFADVLSGGVTAVTTNLIGPAQPAGFTFGSPPVYYDIATTAVYSGLIKLCISYIPAQFSQPSLLSLIHYQGGVWSDVTVSNDTVNGMICGQVSSLSPFTIATKRSVPPPTITITAPTNTNYEVNQPVVASYTCTNANNTVSSCTGTVPSGSNIDTSTTGSKTFTVNATDSLGNSSSASVSYTVLASSLAIALSVPVNSATYTLNESVPSAYTCSDSDEPVTSCKGNVANGANIATSSVGSKSFTVNATDAYNNSISQSVNYIVDYNIFPLYDSTLAVKSGAVIPIKLQLNDTAGIDVSSSSIVVHATGVVMLSTNASETLQSTGSSNPDNDFRFDPTLGTTGGYIFNLSSDGYATGTYALQFTAGSDPTAHTARFEVR